MTFQDVYLLPYVRVHAATPHSVTQGGEAHQRIQPPKVLGPIYAAVYGTLASYERKEQPGPEAGMKQGGIDKSEQIGLLFSFPTPLMNRRSERVSI